MNLKSIFFLFLSIKLIASEQETETKYILATANRLLPIISQHSAWFEARATEMAYELANQSTTEFSLLYYLIDSQSEPSKYPVHIKMLAQNMLAISIAYHEHQTLKKEFAQLKKTISSINTETLPEPTTPQDCRSSTNTEILSDPAMMEQIIALQIQQKCPMIPHPHEAHTSKPNDRKRECIIS